MKTICFTGHRPDRLGGYDWNTPKNQMIMQILKTKIIEVINDVDSNIKIIKFIHGSALGIDQMSFEICKEIRDSVVKLNSCKIELELAIPFKKQAMKWFNKTDIDRYNNQKMQADFITFVDTVEGYELKGLQIGEYHPAKMDLRNKYMVNNSEVIIAVWNGSKSGTANCVNYAKKQNKDIIVINPDDF